VHDTYNQSITTTYNTLLTLLCIDITFVAVAYITFTMFRFLALLLLTVSSSVHAWSSSTCSSFGGSQLATSTAQNGATMEMKKGKANLPPQMRGQYKKAMEMGQMRKAMIDASSPGGDGLPVFNLFVRTKRQNVSVCFGEG
jgi:hypothetical protein